MESSPRQGNKLSHNLKTSRTKSEEGGGKTSKQHLFFEFDFKRALKMWVSPHIPQPASTVCCSVSLPGWQWVLSPGTTLPNPPPVHHTRPPRKGLTNASPHCLSTGVASKNDTGAGTPWSQCLLFQVKQGQFSYWKKCLHAGLILKRTQKLKDGPSQLVCTRHWLP